MHRATKQKYSESKNGQPWARERAIAPTVTYVANRRNARRAGTVGDDDGDVTDCDEPTDEVVAIALGDSDGRR